MGPGPQPGHRAQLSPEHLVKDTTACPSPQHHLLSPGPVSSERTMRCVPSTCCVARPVSFHVCLHLKFVSFSRSLTPPPVSFFFFNTSLLEFSCFTTLC